VPATEALQALLDWSDPWTVYLTYGKIWTPVCLAFTVAAYFVYRRRRAEGAERRLWQVTLAAYAVLTLSVFGDYFTPVDGADVHSRHRRHDGHRIRRNRPRNHDAAQRFPTANHPDPAHELHPVHVRSDVSYLARQCKASADVGLGHRRPRRRSP
jgi:hypothetical protein